MLSTGYAAQPGENPNPLREYLRRHKLTLAEFGKRLGRLVNPDGRPIPTSTMSFYARPMSDPAFILPSRKRLMAMREASKGEIDLAGFFASPKRRRAA